MEISVSTSIAGLLRAVDLQEALETAAEAGFRLLDFPLSVFSRAPDSPLRQPDWLRWAENVKKTLTGMGLRVTQAHAAWDQAIPQDLHEAPPDPLYPRTIAACRALGCEKLVFHPPLYFFPTEDRAGRQRVIQWNIRWFRALLPDLERYRVTAELENLFDYRRVQPAGGPPFPFTTQEDMMELCDGVNSPWVRLCLDTGHGNIAGQDVPGMVRAYGSRLQVLHLNDNYGKIGPIYEDLHLFPGYGALDWGEIFRALRETGFSGVLNLEPVGALPGQSRPVRVLQLRTAREIVLQLAEAAGFLGANSEHK